MYEENHKTEILPILHYHPWSLSNSRKREVKKVKDRERVQAPLSQQYDTSIFRYMGPYRSSVHETTMRASLSICDSGSW